MRRQSEAATALWICRPLKRAENLFGPDPGVTLASLAHPGLNSAAAPRLGSRMKPEIRFNHQPNIRRGTLQDTELLAELGARTFSETFAVDNTPENMAAYLAAAFAPAQIAADLVDPQCAFQVAETDSVAVGYAMLRTGPVPEQVTGERPIELVRLYVSRDSLGTGVVAALMQACIDESKRGGHQTLWLGVWENNKRAQVFYRKWNFREVGTHVFQLGDDPQTDLLMQCSLSD